MSSERDEDVVVVPSRHSTESADTTGEAGRTGRRDRFRRGMCPADPPEGPGDHPLPRVSPRSGHRRPVHPDP